MKSPSTDYVHVNWTRQKRLITIADLLVNVQLPLLYLPTNRKSCVFLCQKYVTCNISELLHGCGWCLVCFWKSMIFFCFFYSTSHLVCLFNPNRRKKEKTWSSSDNRDGCSTDQGTHKNTQRERGNRWRGPRYVASFGVTPGRQAPLASFGSIDI